MKKLRLSLAPEIAFDPPELKRVALTKAGLGPDSKIVIRRRSIDARDKRVVVHMEIDIYLSPDDTPSIDLQKDYKNVVDKDPVVIVGAGPAGLFAAMRLIELGCKPIIIERGKDVRSRRRDLVAIHRKHQIDPDSNYCFGEGGAGTYSDGKLYTRSKKRGDIDAVLNLLVAHGAPYDILVDSHPHIGTNKLPKVVGALRDTILQAGGEIYFQKRIVELLIDQGSIKGVRDQSGTDYKGKAVILATGHSARDIFLMLAKPGIALEAKPFALGLRVEHPQQLIDSIQYHRPARGLLPAAAYSLNHKIQGSQKSVFSFCMCPGGFMVPAATKPGEIVVNGMSPSRRDSKFANSGIVVTVDQGDFSRFKSHGALAGMYFQEDLETKACQMTGGDQSAPAQRLMDFLQDKISNTLVETSYQPGLASTDLKELLPRNIHQGIKEGLMVFGKRMRGYLTNEAQLVGVESRTSSPVRIPRDKDNLQHPQVSGLYPCGEGAGYAGGIMSAALDGIKCAEAVVRN